MTNEDALINEERYRVFVTQSSEAIWRIELDEPISVDFSTDEQLECFYRYSSLAECNEAMAKMYGFESIDEILGARLGDLLPGEDINNVEYLRAFIASNYRLDDAESHEVDRSGNPKIFLNNLIGIVENGFLTRVWGTQRDITESKRAEESLRESREILALSMQSSRMGVWTRDISTGIVWWSEELEEIYGLKKGSFPGTVKNFFDLAHEDDRGAIWNEMQEAIAEHREYSIEFRFWHASGALRWMEGRGRAVYSEKGAPVRLYGVGIDVTERKISEESLRESEERFAKAFNSSPLALTITSLKDGKLIEVNETFIRTTGYTREETVGRTTTELGLWSNSADRENELAAVQKKGEIRDIEYSFRVRDGREIVGLLSAELLEVRGEPCALTVIQDITERKKAAAISERYHLLSMRARDIILFFRPDGQIVDANQMAADTYGYEKSELLRMKLHDLRAPETLDSLEEHLTQANNGGTQFETVHQRKNGTQFPVEVTSVGADIGGERLLISIIRDISERRKNEEALIEAERRASEEYLELLSRIVPVAEALGAARDLLSIYRSLHGFVRASMPCTAFFVSFYNAEKALRTAAYVWGEEGEVDISALPPMPLTADGGPNSQAIFQKKSIVVNRYWDLMKTRPHVVLQENGAAPNSSLVVPMTVMNRIIGTLEVQAYDDEIFTNEHIIALEMVANLAAAAIENVRLLQVEAEAREAAEAANRTKDEFLSVLSHELRTPLNSMLGWLRMLRGGVLDAEKTAKALEVVERNTLLQNDLIEDLLDVSRIISGKMRIEKEPVDLVRIFGEAIEVLRPAAMQKRITFGVAAQEDFLMINGDAMRLQQIIVNLVQNALKFTPEGGAVDISLAHSGNFARIIVKDDGIGIGKDILPHIFERFQQADSSTKRAYSGLGLGLTIVHNLVELHGGTVRAESAGEGQGASFIVEIPLTKEFLESKSGDAQVPNTSNVDFALKGARILLVDDDLESLVPLQIFLEREKAEVVLATSAKEALEKLARETFNVLITDIGMPGTDGYDLIAKVRQLQSEQNAFITAIALTAYASSDDRRRALASGFQEHFAKPVNYDELLAAVRKIHERRQEGN